MFRSSSYEGYTIHPVAASCDPPLMEELGINVDSIKEKIVSVLTYRHVEARVLSNPDMAGPLLSVLFLSAVLLLQGKSQVGYISAFALLGGVVVFSVLHMMSRKREVDLYLTFSILGYSMLPIVLLAALGLFAPLHGKVGGILALASVMWSTATAAKFFETVLELQDQWWLTAYPVALVYTCFTLMVAF